jgi:hypothetical protein
VRSFFVTHIRLSWFEFGLENLAQRGTGDEDLIKWRNTSSRVFALHILFSILGTGVCRGDTMDF